MTTLEQTQQAFIKNSPSLVAAIGEKTFLSMTEIIFESGRLEGRMEMSNESKAYLDKLMAAREQGKEV